MNNKKRAIALALLLSTIGCSNTKANIQTKKDSKIEIQDNYLSYSKGKIYIGEEKYLESLDNLDYFDLLVVDERESSDPNMKIVDSHKIISNIDMIEVLNILKKYEEENPTNWDRSIVSMRNEWIYHNMSYYLSYETGSSKDVDLNNGDEYKYEKKLIR